MAKLAAPSSGTNAAFASCWMPSGNSRAPHSSATQRLPRDDHLPLAIVRPRSRARLGLAPGVVLGFRVEARSAAGRPAASTIVVVHVALAPAALSGARRRRSLAALLPLAAAAASREGTASLAEDLEAHHRYTARATAREAALRRPPLAMTARQAAPVQPGLFDRRAVHEAARQREAREHRRELHNARLAQLALGGHIEERLSVQPVFGLGASMIDVAGLGGTLVSGAYAASLLRRTGHCRSRPLRRVSAGGGAPSTRGAARRRAPARWPMWQLRRSRHCSGSRCGGRSR